MDKMQRKIEALQKELDETLRAKEELLDHLQALKHMDQINRVIQRSDDLDDMLKDILETVLAIFQCDRAWLLYPCDPKAPYWRVPMECTTPEYPGALAFNEDIPMSDPIRGDMIAALVAAEPVAFGPGAGQPVSDFTAKHFFVQAQMFMAIYPKVDKPWLFGIHQCSYAREWTGKDIRLLMDIGRRIGDALGSLLILRRFREIEEKFISISENVLDGIVMIDSDGKINFWNRSAETIFIYTQREAMGQDLHMLVTPLEYHQPYRSAFSKFRVTGEGPAMGKLLEFSAIKKDGTEFPVELSVASLKVGNEWHAVGIVRDITERKSAEAEKDRLENQLRQAQKMEAVGTLASGIAHDFNNILQAISGNLQLILEQKGLDRRILKYSTEIDGAVNRAANLVKRLLTSSRKVEPELKPLDVGKELGQAIGLLKRTIPRMIDIETVIHENTELIYADTDQLNQVLMNMCTNARDAMPDGGKLTIQAANVTLDREFCRNNIGARPGDYVKITFSDTGSGMDEETQKKIFTPFFTTKEVGKGTGLGMAVVYGIVKNHGGYITCESRLNRGATFRIYWPAAPKGEIEFRHEKVAEDTIRGGDELILIVDDEEAILEIAKEFLTDHGYSVLQAGSGEKALEIFKEKKQAIDLIIMDLGMPGIGGHKAMVELLKLDPKAKVVIASGYSADSQVKEALAVGAAGFVGKPYKLNDLLRKIRRVLDDSDQG